MKGLAITYVTDEHDATVLNEVQKRFEVQITGTPDEVDVAKYNIECDRPLCFMPMRVVERFVDGSYNSASS
ncbi:unnamed protein product [Adineta steineri]|uniref:Uncharacterized protein n=1 Tax=Adineta steineri TaxID=433720 RepID=A0A819XA40_9BILA|nr:unnamed protein product [Adineta steineri]